MKKIMPLIYLNFATAVALASEGTLPAKLKSYVANFNLADTETVTNAISNAAASDFLLSNVPLFECSDKDIERTYYFRWWTFRKHLRHGTGHWTVSEFLPEVGWAGPDNSIVCAAGHHFREARWLRDRSIVGDLARFWLSNPATETNRWQYSSWLFTSVRDAVKVSGDEALLRSLLSDAVRYYEQWEKGKDYRLYGRNWKTVVPFRMGLRECGMFASVDNHEGTEITLSGSGFRPLFNCAMWSEANVIASVAAETGDAALAARFKAKADALAEEIKRNLWDGAFFVTMTTNKVRTAAHELHGYAPWYFGMPLAREYDIAFRELAATDGFRAKWGLAFAAQRTPGFGGEHKRGAVQNLRPDKRQAYRCDPCRPSGQQVRHIRDKLYCVHDIQYACLRCSHLDWRHQRCEVCDDAPCPSQDSRCRADVYDGISVR